MSKNERNVQRRANENGKHIDINSNIRKWWWMKTIYLPLKIWKLADPPSLQKP